MLAEDLEFQLGIPSQRTVYVQEEPALEIALPQVFDQPQLIQLQRGRLPNVEMLVAQIARQHQAQPDGGLGAEYQELVAEFQPLFTWATACWDYLLSTEGCRFVPRTSTQRYGIRGDYRVVTDKDYSRVVHGIFRACVLEFARDPAPSSLAQWLRPRFWPLVLESYRRLEDPPDARQRKLTPYSYLRCIPYRFLNDFHEELVTAKLKLLPEPEVQAIDAYFLRFYTEPAAAEAIGRPVEELNQLLRQGLTKLLINERLVYCLLRQIERY
jgi:hypothetical protein